MGNKELSHDIVVPSNTPPREDVDMKKSQEMTDISQIERVISPGDVIKDHMNYDRIDKELAKYAQAGRIDITEAENKRLRRMIDKRVLPVMIFTYFLQALDKGTLSFASIMGIKKDAHLVGQQYSWLTTCIYIAVLIVEYPTNWLIQRVPIAKYLGANIILWSITLALHAACRSFPALVAVRTLLGIFEAVCQPSFLVMSSMWYKRDEQAQIVTYWYMMNGGQQIVGGLLAYCFSLIHHGPLKSWQAIFLTYGCFSVLWGLFVLWWLPDSPMRAKCFSEEDKALMVERVRSNQTGLQNKTFRSEQLKEALLDPQSWCYCLIAICTTLPTSGLGAFANIIISGFDFTVLQTQLLAMVLGAVIVLILLSSTWLVRKTGQNLIVMGVFVIPSFVGTIVLMTVENHNKASQVGLLISYYIVLSFWAAQTLAMSMISRNIAGQTKKTAVVAMNFVAWATGNAIGPQVFLDWNAPRYLIAFAVHMGCYCLLVLVIVFLRWELKRRNEAKDRLAEAGVREANDESLVHAFDDLTDRENPNFSRTVKRETHDAPPNPLILTLSTCPERTHTPPPSRCIYPPSTCESTDFTTCHTSSAHPASQHHSTPSPLNHSPLHDPAGNMTNSLESSRPILANPSNYRASTRLSTYSATPTLTPSIAPSHLSNASSTAGDPRAHDIKSWNAGFERLEDKRLQQQRYVVTPEKNEDMGKLALGAKLERALGRRMTGQDAVFVQKHRKAESSDLMDEKKVST
ncbi:MFS general substrate transporter [Lophium mytilinum]|uniref:MFS general substrate transporter n=1 Tax=Lophium mytilinum TaxID=390894 RepID=A0A6A6RBH7_9PEZI|nr:MFS general substrate transporter [Lophium mytilinum]